MKTLLACALTGALLVSPAAARTWKTAPTNLAQDYSIIVDNRPGGEMVQLMWITWPMVPPSPTVQKMLDQYVILGAVHANLLSAANSTYGMLEAPHPVGADGKPLVELADDDVPAGVAAMIAAMGTVMRKNMGVAGQNLKFYAYQSGDVRACEKGRFSIAYAGETYTYDTPIPGCPKP